MMKRYLLIHYGEIWLKLGNKDYFVDKLKERLKAKLEEGLKTNFVIKHTLGRLMILLPKNFEEEKYAKIVRKIFGIKNFKFVYEGFVDIKKLAEEIWKNLPKEIFEEEKRPKTFKVNVKRSMILPFKSFEVERDLGAILLDKGINMEVKLKNPEFVVDNEFFSDHSYFSFKKYAGPGGLSSNSQGRLISLISSGIDSPVASYLMMKRGARIIFVNFHSYPYGDKDEASQVKDLVKILSDYQFGTKLYSVPFGEIQKEVSTNFKIPAKIRVVLYRRMMLRIAEKIARNVRAKGLITGDSLGQVASQTTENMFAIHEASTIPLFQPLISFDKEEVIKIAENIGTYEISKLPCKESCTMFMPRSPEIRANVYDVKEYEKNLPIAKWVEKALFEAEIIYF